MAEPATASSNFGHGELSVRVDKGEGPLVVTVVGVVDIASAPLLEEELSQAEAADAKLVVVDFAGVEFMDSSGLHVLLKARERFRRGGRSLSMSRSSPQVRRLLELTGTLGLFSGEELRDSVATPRRHGHAA